MSTFSLGAGTQTTPGVYTREADLTASTAAAASSQSGIAGVFAWGPVNQPSLISSEPVLAATFGTPSNENFETWFSAANFLAYAGSLWVNRVVDNTAFSAVANTANVTSLASHTVLNGDDYEGKSASFEAGVKFIAKYPGALGNNLRVSVCGSANEFASKVSLTAANATFANANTKATFPVGSNTATITLSTSSANTPLPYATTIASSFNVGDVVEVGNSAIGTQSVKIVSIGAPAVNGAIATVSLGLSDVVKVADDFSTQTISRQWEFAAQLGSAPKTTWSTLQTGNTAAVDGMHIVVVDEDGAIAGRKNAVLEMWSNVSRATDAKTIDGDVNFYKKVVNLQSQYIYAAADLANLPTANSMNVTSATTLAPTTLSFVGGANGGTETTIAAGVVGMGYLPYANKNAYNMSSILVGKTRGGLYGEQIFNYVIDNVGAKLQNVIVYGSPSREVSVNNADPIGARRNFRTALRSGSYGVCDSGYKYQYDSYNDVYRFVPLCGDIAGISAATDTSNDPWVSPAGFNRGGIKNIVKLAWNPDEGQQGVLFNELDINPVITVVGEGTYLMGDKTLLGQNSAFNSIGVRKLFNILKNNISKAARGLLFENNDEFSQSRFRNQTEPFLRDVKGRRGLESFKVVCDDTNNTDQVKANYQFVGDIYIKPLYSARTVHLNFIGVGADATFDEG